MLSPDTYLKARETAQFHVQAELKNIPLAADTPCEIHLTAEVSMIFRGHTGLKIGDIISFGLYVIRENDAMVTGPVSWTSYENLLKARYMELFLNGQPPNCKIALYQSRIIETLSIVPKMQISK